jgi:hypothetical protein
MLPQWVIGWVFGKKAGGTQVPGGYPDDPLEIPVNYAFFRFFLLCFLYPEVIIAKDNKGGHNHGCKN